MIIYIKYRVFVILFYIDMMWNFYYFVLYSSRFFCFSGLYMVYIFGLDF